jgi:hypothetical protein
MNVVGQLLVELSANVARLRTDMEAASKVVTRQSKVMANAAANVTTALGAIGAGLSVGALVGAFGRAVDSMDALNDVADKTGASVESLSALVNTLAPYGHGLDVVSSATDKLVKAIADADEASRPAAQAFAELGVKTRDASGNMRPTIDVLMDVSKALAQYENGTGKTSIAVALFGKSGADLIPVLKDLAEAEQRSATVTAEQAEAADKALRAMNELRHGLLTLQQAIAAAVLPSLIELYNKLESIARISKNPIDWVRFTIGSASDINSAVSTTEREIERLQSLIEKTQNSLGSGNQANPAFGTGIIGRLINPILADREQKALRDRLIELQGDLARLREIQKTQRNLGVSTAQPEGPPAPKMQTAGKQFAGISDTKASKPTAAREQVTEAQRLLETLERQLLATRNLTAEQDVLARIGSGKLEGLNATLEQQLLLTATLIDKERERAAAVAQATSEETADYEALARMKRQAAADLDNEIEAIRRAVDPTRALWTEIERVKTLLFDGLIPADVGQARLDQLSLDLRRMVNDVGNAAQETRSEMQEFLSPIQSAFEELIFSGAKARDILKGLAQDAARILVRQQITGPLAALVGGQDMRSQGSTLVGQFLRSVGFLADGGMAKAGRPYVVGERGAELFVPKSSGTVVPNHALGGPNITFNVQVASGATRQDVLAGIDAAVATAEQRILRSMRTGGAFARA